MVALRLVKQLHLSRKVRITIHLLFAFFCALHLSIIIYDGITSAKGCKCKSITNLSRNLIPSHRFYSHHPIRYPSYRRIKIPLHRKEKTSRNTRLSWNQKPITLYVDLDLRQYLLPNGRFCRKYDFRICRYSLSIQYGMFFINCVEWSSW